ncbi:MAG: DUF4836 family protein, partial [Saprospiraceae bacterium]
MKKYLFVLVCSLMLFSSCKKDTLDVQMDNAVAHIPADASQVTVIRVPQLMKKADFEEIKQQDFFKQFVNEAASSDPTMAKILENPEESGIDLSKNAYFISDVSPINTEDMMNGIMLNIADAAKVKTMLKSSDFNVSPKVGDGFTYVTRSGGSFVAWNDEILMAGQGTQGSLSTRLERIFNLQEGGSVLGSSDFSNVASSSDDISFWLSSDAISQNPQLGLGSAMLGLGKDDLEGNYINGGVNFEEKRMSFDVDFLLKKVIGNDLNMAFKSKTGTDFSAYIPSKNTFAMTLGLDPAGLKQLLKEKNVLNMVGKQSGVDKLGFTFENFLDALDGDIMLAIQKTGTEGKPAGLFGAKVNVKEFMPIFNKFVDMGQLVDKGNGRYELTDKGMGSEFDKSLGGNGLSNTVNLIMKGDMIFMSADPTFIKAAQEGGLPSGQRISSSEYKSIS